MAKAIKLDTGVFKNFVGGDNLEVNGILPLSGTAIAIGGSGDTVTIPGNLVVQGTEIIQGGTTIGDATSDTIGFVARVNTDFIPSTNATSSLGTPGLGWKDLWMDVGGTARKLNDTTPASPGAGTVGLGTTGFTNFTPASGNVYEGFKAVDAKFTTVDAAIAAISGSTFVLTASANITAGHALMAGTVSNDTAQPANALNLSSVIGIAVTSATTGNPVTIAASGFAAYPIGGLTLGQPVYVDPATPGVLTPTAPSATGDRRVRVGFATKSTGLVIAIGEIVVI